MACSVRVQQIHATISMKSSKITIHENLDPRKFNAIWYSALGFGSCGTIRVNQQRILVTFKQAKPNKGDITTYQDRNILGLKWKDK